MLAHLQRPSLRMGSVTTPILVKRIFFIEVLATPVEMPGCPTDMAPFLLGFLTSLAMALAVFATNDLKHCLGFTTVFGDHPLLDLGTEVHENAVVQVVHEVQNLCFI